MKKKIELSVARQDQSSYKSSSRYYSTRTIRENSQGRVFKVYCHTWIIYMTKIRLKDLKWSGHLIREPTCWKTTRTTTTKKACWWSLIWTDSIIWEAEEKSSFMLSGLRSHSFTFFLFLMYSTSHIVILWFFLFRLSFCLLNISMTKCIFSSISRFSFLPITFWRKKSNLRRYTNKDK